MNFTLLNIWLPWVGGLLLGIGFCFYSFIGLAQFLAVTAPIESDTLLIEGWIPDDAVKEAAVLLKTDSYQQAIIVGPPIWKGAYLSEYKSLAQVTASTLVKLGIEETRLVVIACPNRQHYRTYAGALAVRQWLLEHRPNLRAVNVFSLTAHARRSWLIYRRTLSPQYKTGIIAAQPKDFHLRGWWKTSAGARHVVSEAIAYGYARLFDWRA